MTVGDGDVLFVSRRARRRAGGDAGRACAAGRAAAAGGGADGGAAAGGVENLAEQPYLPLAVRQYVDARTRVLRFAAFDLGRVLSGTRT